MLRLAVLFLVVALIAGVFGFSGISTAAMGIAQVLFFVFLGLCLIALIAGVLVGRALVP